MFPYRIAIQSLRMNRVRTALTTLGIIIGVTSITLVLSLGGGVENAVRSQVSKLDDNVVLVTPGNDTNMADTIARYNPYGVSMTTSLTEQDFNVIRHIPEVKQVAPIMILGGTIVGSLGSKSVPIIATSPELADIIGLSINPGQFIDSNTTRDIAVIGAKLANELFGSNQILGQQFMLKGRKHIVVGVLKETNSPVNLSGIDLDHGVFISFDDGKSFNQGVAQVQQLLVTVKDPTTLVQSQKIIEQAILESHSNEHDFTVLAGQDVANHSNVSFRAVVTMTAVVAAITLFVGGIGIMNIMLVGVSERTREIGIRKALGATNSHIFGQFIIEALIICIVGGIAGLTAGYGLAYIVGLYMSFQPAMNWRITATGLSMSFATGILFGLYPAVKASRKNPIESLRQYH